MIYSSSFPVSIYSYVGTESPGRSLGRLPTRLRLLPRKYPCLDSGVTPTRGRTGCPPFSKFRHKVDNFTQRSWTLGVSFVFICHWEGRDQTSSEESGTSIVIYRSVSQGLDKWTCGRKTKSTH